MQSHKVTSFVLLFFTARAAGAYGGSTAAGSGREAAEPLPAEEAGRDETQYPEVKIEGMDCCMAMWPTVFFEKGTSKILEGSKAVISMTASELVETPGIVKVIVEGNCDEMGSDKGNMDLSAERAGAVVDMFVAKGADAGVLIQAAYGSACGGHPHPEMNNRVRIMTLETAEGCRGCPFACDKAISSGLVPGEAEKYLPGSDYCK
ncbi:MAG: OmpA family protein [Pseudomonadota bacterium]